MSTCTHALRLILVVAAGVNRPRNYSDDGDVKGTASTKDALENVSERGAKSLPIFTTVII